MLEVSEKMPNKKVNLFSFVFATYIFLLTLKILNYLELTEKL